MINNHIRDVQIAFFLQFYSQVFQSVFGKNTKKEYLVYFISDFSLLTTFYMKLFYYFLLISLLYIVVKN